MCAVRRYASASNSKLQCIIIQLAQFRLNDDDDDGDDDDDDDRVKTALCLYYGLIVNDR